MFRHESSWHTRPSPTMAGVESLTKSPLSAFFSTDTLFLLHSVAINVLLLCDTELYSKPLFLVASVPIEKKLSRCRGFFPSGYPVAHLWPLPAPPFHSSRKASGCTFEGAKQRLLAVVKMKSGNIVNIAAMFVSHIFEQHISELKSFWRHISSFITFVYKQGFTLGSWIKIQSGVTSTLVQGRMA